MYTYKRIRYILKIKFINIPDVKNTYFIGENVKITKKIVLGIGLKSLELFFCYFRMEVKEGVLYN